MYLTLTCFKNNIQFFKKIRDDKIYGRNVKRNENCAFG